MKSLEMKTPSDTPDGDNKERGDDPLTMFTH